MLNPLSDILCQPSGGPREAITHHEVVAPRVAGPSGRTDTSWSGHYAAFKDRFRIPWEINCER